MTRLLVRTTAAALALGGALTALSACTDDKPEPPKPPAPAGPYQLVAFDSCAQALTGLRAALSDSVGPYGVIGWGRGPIGGPPLPAARDAMGAAEGAVAPQPAPQGAPQPAPPGALDPAEPYSGTNTHEVGVDEPDLVKTDGRRIVTVTNGVLRVVDVASRQNVGRLDLNQYGYGYSNLLLAGDHALVLANAVYRIADDVRGVASDEFAPNPAVDPVPPVGPKDWPISGPRLLLVDLSGPPRVLSTLTVDGYLLDARQVGTVAQVVVRSVPRIMFPDTGSSEKERIKQNREVVADAPIDAWLPRIEIDTGGAITHPKLGCDAISRPTEYSGSSILTVLSLDLAGGQLQAGQPVVLAADGNTVYGSGPNLYVASDQRWRPATTKERAPARTEIYRFDVSGAGRPRFVAGGSVPGYLLNQYAMSEWDGYLRVATTTGQPGVPSGTRSSSGVHVLAVAGGQLAEIGKVTGLGKGEQIYAVRFLGPVGYVVTFRQTDPLYTVDLSDPRRPTVRGALKIPGYSAYLHPLADGRLLGIGQDATGRGSITGMQVSLFDVSDLDGPTRLARYTVEGANSQAEFDPHAFLYWANERLLVIPLQVYGRPMGDVVAPDRVANWTSGALLLRVDGDRLTRIGFIQHPAPAKRLDYLASIERSLVIGQTLWTMSAQGMLATDLATLTHQAWVPFD